MPPHKRGEHASAPQAIAAQMYQLLSDQTGQVGQPSFQSVVAAFTDMPGIIPALGFPDSVTSADVSTGASLLSNMSQSFHTTLQSNGPRFAAARSIAESTASTMYGPDINLASMNRITGMSSAVFKKGGALQAANAESAPSQSATSIPVTRTHVYPLLTIFEWYHGPECVEVEIDKQSKKVYKRKKFTLPNETILDLTCEHRIRYCPLEELAASYMESATHAAIMQGDPLLKLNIKTAQECICDCIKECTVLECICPVCTGHKFRLEAWDKMRNDARKTEPNCACPQCLHGTKWRSASLNTSAWREASTCGKTLFVDLENPADGSTPRFNHLRCSLLPKKMSNKRKRELGIPDDDTRLDHYPPYAGDPCSHCGWESFAPANCPIEMSDTPCTWTELQEKGPNGEAIYCDYVGTRKELFKN